MSNKKTNQKEKSDISKLGIVPLGDKVLVRPFGKDELEKKSASGIIIPDTVSKEAPDQGEVMAVGPGRYDAGQIIPMTVKVGDKVLFSKYGYEEVKVDGKDYYIFSESSIMAVIK
jgi:chaperonin GroES